MPNGCKNIPYTLLCCILFPTKDERSKDKPNKHELHQHDYNKGIKQFSNSQIYRLDKRLSYKVFKLTSL
jgi:hypothetical protein